MGEVTPQFLAILRFFFESQDDWYSGSQVMKITKLPSGTVYPLLLRMHEGGWLDLRLEHIDPEEEGRPQGRFYRLSEAGHREVMKLSRQLNLTEIGRNPILAEV